MISIVCLLAVNFSLKETSDFLCSHQTTAVYRGLRSTVQDEGVIMLINGVLMTL